jgi:ComF family protein
VLRDLREGLVNLFFPPICILCKKYLPPSDRLFQICLSCRDTIEPNRPPFCQRCSRPIRNVNKTYCRTCEETSPYFDRAWGAIVYNGTAQELLHLFKYGGKTGLRQYFGANIKNFTENFRVDLKRFDLIVPIPLHPTRERERGYNQAELLAQKISQDTGIPSASRLLLRRRHTPNQAALSQKERWTNISGAFKIKHSFGVHAKNILLVDDLYTTGATCSEAAQVLKACGANEIQVLTAAIARLEKEN